MSLTMSLNILILLGLFLGISHAYTEWPSGPTGLPPFERTTRPYGSGRPSGTSSRPSGRPSPSGRPPFLPTREPRMEENEEHTVISRLIKRNYPGPHARPVERSEETLMPQVYFIMQRLASFDRTTGLATVTGYIKMTWQDAYLVRDDPEDHLLIDDVRVPIAAIWMPDIQAFDTIDETLRPTPYARARYDGQVTYVQKAKYTVPCEVREGTGRDSYDATCSMAFRSQNYGRDQMCFQDTTSENNHGIELLSHHPEWGVENISTHLAETTESVPTYKVKFRVYSI